MARAALGWSLDDLAGASGVSRRTIARFEAGETVLPVKVLKMRTAIETKGVRFVDSGSLAGGVIPPNS
jgi:transcriptional regulator with XRE-family HTH domain